jgi:hypothetical protein
VNINRNPSLQLSSSTLDFGSITVGQIADRTLNVRNTGSGWLDLSAFRTSKDQFVPAVVEPLRVRPLSERPLTLRYVSRLSGSDTAELTFNSNDAAAGANALSLRATVFERPVPSVAISTSSLDYGEVPAQRIGRVHRRRNRE